jgi:hypothetical protein
VIELLSQYRAPINLLFVFVLACFVLFRLISLARTQLSQAASKDFPAPAPQHPLLRAVDAAAAIGIGIAWTALIYTGPSLGQLWHGQDGASHWTAVLLYTWLWLSVRPPTADKGTAAVLTSIVVRTALYGLFFAIAIATLNNW